MWQSPAPAPARAGGDAASSVSAAVSHRLPGLCVLVLSGGDFGVYGGPELSTGVLSQSLSGWLCCAPRPEARGWMSSVQAEGGAAAPRR